MHTLAKFVLLVVITTVYTLNDRPIIGILAQTFHQPHRFVNGTSYISASYVKFLESAGARVVPIPTNTTNNELKKIFTHINGLLLPGGDADLMNSPYRRNAEMIFNLAMQAKDDGEYFPIWGTCLGFQTLNVLAAKSCDVISSSAGTWDHAMRLNLTEHIETSRMFTNVPNDVIKILQSEDVTYNAHHNCVSADSYKENPGLQEFFNVLSTNVDANGKSFLSTIEARHYPFYGVQWHPEMNMYEFTINEGLGTHINHSKNAVYIAQYFATFFVNEARKSNHHFNDAFAEEEYLIYNYKPYHAGVHGWFEEQIYVF